ncbi:hypothetical protein [Nitrosopumilus sp. b2]|uniref:type IV toxin-antitoxin system AbiEi family antitoxin domain-containing protein n=1 Tax=Nitrosopumilus sp. b2 TaxID=2109908 RepID=UPI0015F76628|nr:hypothetical protein [Nitrosopumilus sp. b2]KAF6245472.1 hypothetical protein C6989_03315 [Nitrosopumilus sp. b2]
MESTILLKKFKMENKDFITAEELEKHCTKHGFEYENLVRYYERRGYFVRIFKGIFHIRTPEEIKEGYLRYTHLELVAKGLELKKIKNWYFGLHTALKLNNMTHEHFTIDEVINNKISREKPMKIMEHNFKFIKTAKPLFNFGILNRRRVRYSDPEKTILDFIYLWKSNGVSSDKITYDVSEWSKEISHSKLEKYSIHYPKSVHAIIRRIKN